MSSPSPASGLENLSLSDVMPLRTRSMDVPRRAQGPSGRKYDLCNLPVEMAGAAHDGLRARNMRLMPVLKKATYPDAGFVGFEVTEIHSIRIPLSDDREFASDNTRCNCPSFQRIGLCDHVVWLYDGLRACLDTETTSGDDPVDTITETIMLDGFKSMAEKMPQQARGLTERVNRIQPDQPDAADIDQEIIDMFSVFDGVEDDSPRKRRRGDESLEESRTSGKRSRTCVEISPEEFFRGVQPPTTDIRDVVVSGNLLTTLKGLVRYGTLFRESLAAVINPHFRADDFLTRLESFLIDWKDRWENFRKDRRTTVPSSFITDYADNMREVVHLMKAYEEHRDCPDSFHDHAIDLGISILDEVLRCNADLYEGHSRQNSQARHTVPQHSRDRNVFINLIIDPPAGQTGFVRSLVEMLFQFGPEKIYDSDIEKLNRLYAELQGIDKVQSHHISPLQNFFDQYAAWSRKRGAESGHSTPSQASHADSGHEHASSGQRGSRRYRELRAAPSNI